MRPASRLRYLAYLAAAALFTLSSSVHGQPADEFETFVVPAPQRPVAAQTAGVRRRIETAKSRSALKPTTVLRSSVTATLFPGMNGLSATSAGNIGSRVISSNFAAIEDPSGAPNSTGYLKVQQSDRGIELGSGILNMLGSNPGIRFFTTHSNNAISVGEGLYLFQSPFRNSRLIPMVDSQWKLDKNESLMCGAGTDGTWTTSFDLRKGSLGASLQSLSNAEARSSSRSAAIQKHLSSSASVFASTTTDSAAGGLLTSYGIVKRIGEPTLSLQTYGYSNDSLRFTQNSFGILWPARLRTFSLRLVSEAYNSKNAGNADSGRTTSVEVGLSTRISRTLSVWETSTVSTGATSNARPALEALFGADDRISPRWHVTTSFSHGLASSDFSVAGSIEYAYDSDLRLRLLYGPKLQYIDPGLSGTVFGFQIVRSFDYDYAPSGAVDGRIFVDDQMCAVPVQVAIDDGDPVTCDKSGRFAITHLALGDHAVKIVPESLPADLSSDEADIPVTVASGKQVACNFHLHKVGQIVGSIDTTADQLGHLDPSARVAVVLHDSAGDIASTDLDGAFTISNLRAGQYSISIDERSLPPDYEVQEPKSVDVAVAPGGPPPKIHFTISPKAHTVIYETTH